MRKPFLLVLLLLAGSGAVLAQFGSFSDVPVEIRADGGTRFEGRHRGERD